MVLESILTSVPKIRSRIYFPSFRLYTNVHHCILKLGHAKPQPLRTGVVAFGPLLSKYLHNSQRAPTQCSGQFSYSAIIPSSFLPHCVIYLGVSAGSENYQQFFQWRLIKGLRVGATFIDYGPKNVRSYDQKLFFIHTLQIIANL